MSAVRARSGDGSSRGAQRDREGGFDEPAPGRPDVQAAGEADPGRLPTGRATPPEAETGGRTDQESARGGASGQEVPLLDPAEAGRFQQRWSEVQARFVDDPREAVGAAEGLVAEVMRSLSDGFAEHQARLEAQWKRGGDVQTEELRQALQRYRSFFHRLLSA